MILCLDVGNSQIFGGVFDQHHLKLRFRYDTKQNSTSDQLGIFFKSVLRENGLDSSKVAAIGMGSVVPNLDHSLASACIKYFYQPPFVLQAGVKTGLTIATDQPDEVGADLIAGAIAAVDQFPGQNIIIVDFGTATTFTAINANKEFLGVVIQAGIRTSMTALQTNTAKLPLVGIVKPQGILGRHTIACIQAGLYYGQLGALHEIISGITQQVFDHYGKPLIIGTGGFVNLFESEAIFDEILPDLVLNGIRLALQLNKA